jgi:A/G-specific adenine glycosylase
LHGWQGLGYYSRARSLHKAAAILKDGFPESEQELLAIPGVGPYTAGAIAAIAYDLKTAPVDGNIGRIFSRLYKINEVKPKLYGTVKTLLTDVLPERGNGDFIQGLMDVGATICLPKEPKCHLCPLSLHCLSFQTGAQAQYPLRAPKKERPRRFGQVFWIEDDEGRVLIEKRPEKGLLGGMMGFPTTPWVEKLDFNRGEKGQVEHTFTHFHLILNVTRSVKSSKHFEGLWVHPSELKLYALPTVMKKVVKVVLG